MLAGLVAAWFYVPGALAAAVTVAITVGGYAYFLTPLMGEQALPAWIRELPLISDAAENLLFQSNGVMAALLGVVLGGAIGFVFGVLWVLIGPFQDSVVDGLATVFGSFVIGIVVGLLYTAYRVIFERRILQVNGVRRLSRREAEVILPLVDEAAARLGLPNHPPVLIDDARESNAFAYTRHIVVNVGLLEEFNYDPEPIAAVIAHELVHWRNGDGLSAVFVRGVALPLYLLQAGGGWLRARAGSSVLRFFVWIVFWPVFVTVQYFVVPMQAADSRRAEYRADEGAVLAGRRAGMRRMLNLRRSFEDGRNGWVSAVCASHPPSELRLERLEVEGGSYQLPDKDSPASPLPVSLTGNVH